MKALDRTAVPPALHADPKPYVWTATAESILAKVARARAALNQQASQNRDGPLTIRWCRRDGLDEVADLVFR